MDFQNPETWVFVALGIFFLILIFSGALSGVYKSLGEKGKAVQAELDEAVRIRQEATDLLNAIKAQKLSAEQKARDIVAQAEADALAFAEDAKVKLADSIKRRQAQAELKIAQAEARAEADVKAAAADLAAQIAQNVLATELAGAKSDPLVDQAIGQIDKRLA